MSPFLVLVVFAAGINPITGPVDPVTGQPRGLPPIPGGWKPGAPSKPGPGEPISWNPIDTVTNKNPVTGSQPRGSWDNEDQQWRLTRGDGGPVEHYLPNGTRLPTNVKPKDLPKPWWRRILPLLEDLPQEIFVPIMVSPPGYFDPPYDPSLSQGCPLDDNGAIMA